MKLDRTLATIIAIAAVLVVAASAVSVILMKFSNEKKYREKWEDYSDCGAA